MPLPKISITFEALASTAIRRSEKGIVAVLLKDTANLGGLSLSVEADIPDALTAANRDYLARTFLGYVSAPRRVLCYVLPAEAENLTEALAWLSTQTFDYVVAPPDAKPAECTAIHDWIKAQRAQRRLYKAVLPETVANDYAVVNFSTAETVVGGEKLNAAQMCSRIAGLIAGTPMTISCTYAPLTEAADCTRLSQTDGDTAVDAGKLILVHDGSKVKVGRGVTSMTTIPVGKSAIYKKIKIVELLDMIEGDIRTTLQDTYIGKMPNTYDNKMVLVTAISNYLKSLENSGLLRVGSSTVDVDAAAQRAYLEMVGTDVSEMNEQELREANTGSEVFLTASVSPIDAIEDITLNIAL